MKLEFQKSKTAGFFYFSMQYSFQLADTVGAKKKTVGLLEMSVFWKVFNISLNFENRAFFSTYKV